jgi:hypothetical protein
MKSVSPIIPFFSRKVRMNLTNGSTLSFGSMVAIVVHLFHQLVRTHGRSVHQHTTIFLPGEDGKKEDKEDRKKR